MILFQYWCVIFIIFYVTFKLFQLNIVRRPETNTFRKFTHKKMEKKKFELLKSKEIQKE